MKPVIADFVHRKIFKLKLMEGVLVLIGVKRTALYDSHKKLGGKIVEFAGWELPLQYEGIIPEHEAVRNAAGLFDVSHMGEIEVKGNDAAKYIQFLVTNDVEKLSDNQVMYAIACYSDGGVVDDLLVYKFDEKNFLLVVNASNADKDYEWFAKNKVGFNVELNNISNSISEVALQGPKAEEILQKLTDTNLCDIKFFFCKKDVCIGGVACLISRTGYTGEDGFEIYTANRSIESVWNNILCAGREFGIKPAGLGCRDTLRFEACLPLYGDEISKDITPLEAGLGYFVDLKKNFIGRDALAAQNSEGLKRKLVGFEMKDKGIPRHGYDVVSGEDKIGFVTTGYFSPTLKKNIGLALIDSKYSRLGGEIEIIIRGKKMKAEIVSKRFYVKKYKK